MKIKERLVVCFKKYAPVAWLGALAVGALPPYNFPPCIFAAFSVLVFLLNKAENKKRAAALGFWFGFGFFAIGLSWVCQAFLIDGMGFEAFVPLPVIGFGLWGGLFPMAACLIAFYFPSGWRRLLAFSAAWGIMEWARSWLFTGFPWNPVASVWSSWPAMLQTASLWGAFGLSAVTVFAAGLPGLIKGRRIRELTPLGASVLIVTALSAFGFWRLSKAPDPTDTINGVNVRLVQPNIPQGKKWSEAEAEQNLMKLVHLSRAEGAEKISHVVWPETATQFLLLEDEFARGMVTSALLQGGILLAGSLRTTRDKTGRIRELFNSIVVMRASRWTSPS